MQAALEQNLPGWSVRLDRRAKNLSDEEVRSTWTDRTGLRISNIDGNRFVVEFEMLAEIEIDLLLKTILISRSQDLDNATIEHLVLDQAMPRILSHQHHFVLHAAGVVESGGILLFVGESGRGKSTISAFFSSQGRNVISDDVVIVAKCDEKFLARGLYSSIRLRPDSLTALGFDEAQSADLAFYSDKKRLVSPSIGDMLLPIKAIFHLGRKSSSTKVSPVSSGEACMALVKETFALDPSDVHSSHARTSFAAGLAAAVSNYHLDYPRLYSRLPEVASKVISVAMEEKCPN